MMIGKALKDIWKLCNRHAGLLFVAGTSLAILYNTRHWQKDRQRLDVLLQQENEPDIFPTFPRVSILLPAWNEAQNVGACIESILNLRYPDKELVICAGGGDGTLEIAEAHAGDRVIVLKQCPGEGKQAALRHCFARASGDIIFLTDADCLIDDICFEHTLAPLITGQDAAATGSWRPLNRQLYIPFVQYQWTHHLYRETRLPDYVPILGGANAAVNRKALEQVNAFEVEAPVGTDYVLSKQLTAAGYRIRFQRESRMQTEYPERFNTYIMQISRWFRNPLVMGENQWKKDDLAKAHLWSGSATIAMLGFPALAVFGLKVLWYPWLLAFVHLICSQVRMTSIARARSRQRLGGKYPSIHFLPFMFVGWLALARGLLDTLNPLRQKQW